MQADSVVPIRTVLLTSGFGSSTRGERHHSYYADHTIWPHQHTAHLVVFKISVSRDLKILTAAAATVENSTLCPNGRELICLPAWSYDSFSKSSNSQEHLFRAWRHPHSSSFPTWGLLWQLWLTYPLGVSLKLYPMTIPWTKRLD